MRLEEELKTRGFTDEVMKANINVLFTASWLHARISAMLRKYGLSHEQYNVLRILRGQHPGTVCQRDILSRMIDRNSNLTRIVAKLKEKGLVNVGRSEADRREYKISLNEKALPVLAQIDEDFKDPALAPVNSLNTSEAFHLNHLLDKMREEPPQGVAAQNE